jgi:cyclic pyranopterin phosphate synthase
MVDVSAKPIVPRRATARGEIRLQKSTLAAIQSDQIAKGNVFATARLAGILAAKQTAALIPLCHCLPLSHCGIEFEIASTADRVLITATASTNAGTGVEMEALCAVSIAALAIYDMCKGMDSSMRIGGIRLVSKIKGP